MLFDALEPIQPLGFQHDHGSQFMSDDFPERIRVLGTESSPAFVYDPVGNGSISPS